jgi:hypothetical protein
MATKPAPEPPELDPAYSSLSLDDLRALRRELGEEETRVSYWRRIIQARIDLLTKGTPDGDLVERLTAVLSESGSVHRRLANLSVRPADDLEALPDLHQLWTRLVDTSDAASVESFVAELQEAEQTLSGMRREIHHRLDEATGQLIARYRQDPTQALTALPDIGLR